MLRLSDQVKRENGLVWFVMKRVFVERRRGAGGGQEREREGEEER